ncbi:DnaB-like helicase C-terminal domain-containing protein [bacterium]|nr:DnaB-like helicase C-terminal domain-containing protein [bacterium]
MDNQEYTEEIQELFLRFIVSDPELFVRVNTIVQPYMFNKRFQKTIEFIQEHTTQYNAIPTIDQISATTGIELERVDGISDNHTDWFLDSIEKFCRHKALEKAILDSTDLLEKADYGAVEEKIKEASQVSLVKDLGIEYFENPKERLEWIKQQAGAISTGWKMFDQKLYGGLNKGEITIFAGGSGAGKSLFLQNLGVNWALAGMNVVYISLELSEQLISMRLDAMVSEHGTKDIMKNIDDVDLKVRMKGKGAGKFRVKQMANGVTANDIRAYVREYEINHDVKVDALLVDYLDLMSPISARVSPGDLFIKDKYVSEELRNLAVEKNILFATASQLNRGAVEEIEFDHHHIAGGISKIQTADNVVGIFTSNAMRERGRYQIQFMKTRSSSGVGQKVDLKFCPDTLRVSDLDEEDEDAMTMSTNSLVDQLKRTNTIKTEDEQSSNTVNQALNIREFMKKNDL